MGVMESVDLKQKNFPFRKKFEEFYPEDEASLVLKKAFCMFFGQHLELSETELWLASKTDTN